MDERSTMKDGYIMEKEEIRRLFPEVEKALQLLAGVVDAALPPGYGFTLTAQPYGHDGFLTYVTNCGDRGDMIKLVDELSEVLKKRTDSPPGHLGGNKN